MRYLNGDTILLGDRVRMGGGMEGVIVAILETKKFSDEYLEREWGYLSTGVLIESVQAGIVHYPDIVIDISLLARGVE